MDEGSGKPVTERPTRQAYVEWLAEQSTRAEVSTARMRMESVSARLLTQLEASEFWKRLSASLDELNDEYTSEKKYKLFITTQPPTIVAKPYESLLDKTYRKNIRHNSAWPDPPKEGWITPANWYWRINDLVRTTFVVKYLDGVNFLVDRLQALAESFGHAFDMDYEARETGYYAAHCYVKFDIDIPALNWDVETISASFEIQVTTQLQELIRNLTHGYYEIRRSQEAEPALKWQWDYKSPEFIPNYLGHILHCVEGMIMEIRDRSEEH